MLVRLTHTDKVGATMTKHQRNSDGGIVAVPGTEWGPSISGYSKNPPREEDLPARYDVKDLLGGREFYLRALEHILEQHGMIEAVRSSPASEDLIRDFKAAAKWPAEDEVDPYIEVCENVRKVAEELKEFKKEIKKEMEDLKAEKFTQTPTGRSFKTAFYD